MVSVYGGGNADACNIQIKADSISAIIATYSRIRERIVLGCNYKADFMMQLGVVVFLHPRPFKISLVRPSFYKALPVSRNLFLVSIQ